MGNNATGKGAKPKKHPWRVYGGTAEERKALREGKVVVLTPKPDVPKGESK